MSESSVIEMVELVLAEFGEMNILHNNAAGKSNNLDRWREIMDTNLDGMYLVAKHVGKVMKEQRKKVLIFRLHLYMV
ncbi:SDR family NAD(P)-dependent oxidoreductase [Sporosarcina sp. FSL K6-6792]|uniref:SDR family NAD(P)-dependent oxidoreductase n=1 Tax=Sporosarcina sp. FSL K6-6792 TaxID=2921559 RepID=UPI0030FBEC42